MPRTVWTLDRRRNLQASQLTYTANLMGEKKKIRKNQKPKTKNREKRKEKREKRKEKRREKKGSEKEKKKKRVSVTIFDFHLTPLTADWLAQDWRLTSSHFLALLRRLPTLRLRFLFLLLLPPHQLPQQQQQLTHQLLLLLLLLQQHKSPYNNPPLTHHTDFKVWWIISITRAMTRTSKDPLILKTCSTPTTPLRMKTALTQTTSSPQRAEDLH